MFIDLFPKTLFGMARQTYPRHRMQPVMHAMTSVEEYQRYAHQTPREKQILHDNELAEARKFSLDKRQQEWLTVRICAKRATLQYYGAIAGSKTPLSPREIRILNEPNGRPKLGGSLPAELQHADLSLSHGAGYSLAIVADSRCGIDIQEPRDAILRVREKFCTLEEEELLKQVLGELPERQYLTLMWTAKEAAKKTLSHSRMPGFSELILTTLEPHAAGWAIELLVSSRQFKEYPPTLNVIAELYEEYSLALCLSGEKVNA